MFETFQSLIPFAANRLNIKREVTAALICETARKILIGNFPDLQDDIKVRYFKNKTIFLWARNSSANSEFFYSRTTFLKSLNEKLEENIVENVRVATGQKRNEQIQ